MEVYVYKIIRDDYISVHNDSYSNNFVSMIKIVTGRGCPSFRWGLLNIGRVREDKDIEA